jgi:hypothetical protein
MNRKLTGYGLEYHDSIAGNIRFKFLDTNLPRPFLGTSLLHKAFLEVKQPEREADHMSMLGEVKKCVLLVLLPYTFTAQYITIQGTLYVFFPRSI